MGAKGGNMLRLVAARPLLVVALLLLAAGVAGAETWHRAETWSDDDGDRWRAEQWLTQLGGRSVLVWSYYFNGRHVLDRSQNDAEAPADDFEVVLTPPLIGRYRFVDPWGSVFDLTLLPGRFELRYKDLGAMEWVLSGTAMIDLDNGRAELTDLQRIKWTDGKKGEPEPYNDGAGSIAFVPFGRGIALSPPWDEANPEMPLGYYGMFFERAD